MQLVEPASSMRARLFATLALVCTHSERQEKMSEMRFPFGEPVPHRMPSGSHHCVSAGARVAA